MEVWGNAGVGFAAPPHRILTGPADHDLDLVQSMRVVEQLKSGAKVLHDKVDTLQAKTIKGKAETQRAF